MPLRRLLLIGWAVSSLACGYQPGFRDCEVSCASVDQCPDGFTCGPEGLCVGPEIGGCAGGDAGPGDGIPTNPDADLTCVCTDAKTLSCASGVTSCPFGCEVEGGVGRCNSFQAANGVTADQLIGVTSALVLATGAQGRIDTSTGEIRVDNAVLRPAGLGVIAGIGFYPLDDDKALFAVTAVQINANATLRGRGTRALVVLSAGDIVISGKLDVSAGCEGGGQHCGGPGGSNGGTSNVAATGFCAGGDSIPGSIGQLRGAGGGGFGQPGSTTTCSASSGSGQAGEAGLGDCGFAELDSMTAGFGGGFGGHDGGGGGGTLQLTSLTAIRFTNTSAKSGIRAAGAGGKGFSEQDSDSAGGGGSGGGILVEAPTVTFAASTILAANGGGGGGTCIGATAPLDGEDGRFDTLPAAGGGCATNSCCGSQQGASGGARGTPAGSVPTSTCSGGGGGGVGRIRINTTPNGVLGNATFSPEPTFGFLEAER